MSGATTSATGEHAEYIEPGDGLAPRRRRRRRWLITVVVLVLIAAGVVVGGVVDSNRRNAESSEKGSATSLATVQRRTLSTRQQFTGTLGYAGSYTVLGRAPGTVTWLPTLGRVVRQGQVLYRVDGMPVVLLYGSTPAYRPLAQGVYASDVKGRDVAQLNHDLVALGYVQRTAVASEWREFSWTTKAGVERLQHPPRGAGDRHAGPG